MEPSFRLKMTLENVSCSIFATPPFILQVNLLLFLAGSMSIALTSVPVLSPRWPSVHSKWLKKSCCRQKAARPLCSLVHGERAQGWQTATALSPPGVGWCPRTPFLPRQKSNFLFCVTYSASSASEKEGPATLPADQSSLWKHWQIIFRMCFPETLHFFLSAEVIFM